EDLLKAPVQRSIAGGMQEDHRAAYCQERPELLAHGSHVGAEIVKNLRAEDEVEQARGWILEDIRLHELDAIEARTALAGSSDGPSGNVDSPYLMRGLSAR